MIRDRAAKVRVRAAYVRQRGCSMVAGCDMRQVRMVGYLQGVSQAGMVAYRQAGMGQPRVRGVNMRGRSARDRQRALEVGLGYASVILLRPDNELVPQVRRSARAIAQRPVGGDVGDGPGPEDDTTYRNYSERFTRMIGVPVGGTDEGGISSV